jgi:hypothetical protein
MSDVAPASPEAAHPPAISIRAVPVAVDTAAGAEGLKELRAFRRRKRIGDIAWFDAAYQAYLVGLVGIVVTLFTSDLIDDARLDASGLRDFADRAPAWIGLAVAVAVAVGMRSGSRGGPVAVTAGDVRHVLLAPVERGPALRPLAVRNLRFALFAGLLVGGALGQIASKRLPSSGQRWIVAGAVTGATIAFLSVAVAMVCSGLKLPRWAATVAALLVVTWGVVGVAVEVWSPMRWWGELAMWPLDQAVPGSFSIAEAGAALAATIAVGVAGMAVVGGVRLEDAERRTALVGQLRFAVTLQDLRTVLVLRRQLAQDRPRVRPWIRVANGRLPIWRRAWRGLLRFPLPRIGRLMLLGAIAGVAAQQAVGGTTPLLLATSVALFLAGLDVLEPLAQEVDQPDRTEAYPQDRGEIMVRLLPASLVAMALVALIGAVAAVVSHVLTGTGAAGDAVSGPVVAVAAMGAVAAGFGGAMGAAVSVVSGAPDSVASATDSMVPPEVAGMRVAFKAVWPLLVATFGVVPLLVTQRSMRGAGLVAENTASAALPVVVVLVLVVLWVRSRDRLKGWFKGALEEGQQASQDRLRERSAA